MFGLDQPSHLLILLIVLVLLFGSAKLPKLARSLGESARIFKKEAQKLQEENGAPSPQPATPAMIESAQVQPAQAQPAQAQPVQAQAQPVQGQETAEAPRTSQQG